ncbi:hypothetical protein CFP56_007061 [Quercus suber]|uniref:Uncharacterized protein n=1 Tax=Quercus suber TaxID=58331 RepID=A0AAW0L8N9_QUESU
MFSLRESSTVGFSMWTKSSPSAAAAASLVGTWGSIAGGGEWGLRR